jgi:TusA-related sulfurtransferase
MTQAIVADVAIDITAETCPMTFVRTRLALDRLAPGQILSVTLRGEEPLRNVPTSAARLGHTILSQTQAKNGATTLHIRRA